LFGSCFVLQLCATSTVGIAAVGYSLGQADTSLPYAGSTKRKATAEAGEEDREHGAGATEDHGVLENPFVMRPTPKSVRTAPVLSTTPRTPLYNDDTSDFQRRTASDPRKMSTLSTEDFYMSLSRRGYNDSQLFDPTLDFDSYHRLSSQHSWLGRRSIKSRSTASPRDSIAISVSNASSAPMLHPRPHVAPRPPPNKLVKRMPSQSHAGSRLPLTPDTKTSGLGSLRRPATSHQRSATLHELFLHDDAEQKMKALVEDPALPAKDIPRSAPEKGQHSWRMFFKSRPLKIPRTRRVSNLPVETHVKSIAPDYNHHPTLLMSYMIAQDTKDVDKGTRPNSSQEDMDFFDQLSGTPSTPGSLGAALAPLESPSDIQAERRRTKRHTLNLGNLLPANKPSWVVRSKSVRSRAEMEDRQLRRETSQPVLRKRQSVPASTGVAGRRKDITDPTIFTRHGRAQTETGNSDSSNLLQISDIPTAHNNPNEAAAARLHPGAAEQLQQQRSNTQQQHHQHQHLRHFSTSNNANRPTTSSGTLLSLSHSRRHSNAAPSERASTLIGSDSEPRGITLCDDEQDFQSETAFDSVRTRATGLSSNRVRLETLFDQSPPANNNKAELPALQDLLPQDNSRDTRIKSGNGIYDQDGQRLPSPHIVSTTHTSVDLPSRNTSSDTFYNALSDPSTFSRQLNLGKLEWDTSYHNTGQHGGGGNWPVDDSVKLMGAEEDMEEDWDDEGYMDQVKDRLSSPPSTRSHQRSSPEQDDFSSLTPQQISTSRSERENDPRNNLFTWSEQPSSDKNSSNGNSPRPRTVHGKHSLEMRGGRPTGRKPLNAAHIRSQSVPVQDNNGEAGGLTAKFGALGIGSKGASEDWDNDFAFDDEESKAPADLSTGERRVDSGVAMVVPKDIVERQANVLGHLGHVREFALLVEDLKRLRQFAASKDIIGENPDLWEEAEGIIALATIDDDEPEFIARSPVASTFEFDAFEEESPSNVMKTPRDGRRRRSVLLPADDVFGNFNDLGEQSTPTKKPSSSTQPRESSVTSSPLIPMSERKDPALAARDLVENMHQLRTAADPVLPAPSSASSSPSPIPEKQKLPASQDKPSKRKTPFDTTTLRDLVAHANTVRRSLAELVRQVDSANPSPDSDARYESPRVRAESPLRESSSVGASPAGLGGRGLNRSAKKKIPASWQVEDE
jgi:hypothetical protein